MPAILEPERLAAMPLWAQVLVGVRLLRRALLAMHPDDATGRALQRATEGVEAFCGAGRMMTRDLPGWVPPAGPDPSPVRHAAGLLMEALAAADRHDDAEVAASVGGLIRTLADDPRVQPVQLAILISADISQLQFACDEAGLGRYDALGGHVLLRLAPVHAITLITPPPPPEDAYR